MATYKHLFRALLRRREVSLLVKARQDLLGLSRAWLKDDKMSAEEMSKWSLAVHWARVACARVPRQEHPVAQRFAKQPQWGLALFSGFSSSKWKLEFLPSMEVFSIRN